MAYIVNTGLLTSVCALCVLVTVSKRYIYTWTINPIALLLVCGDALKLYLHRFLRELFETWALPWYRTLNSLRSCLLVEVYFNALLAMLNARGKLSEASGSGSGSGSGKGEALHMYRLPRFMGRGAGSSGTGNTSSTGQTSISRGYSTDLDRAAVRSLRFQYAANLRANFTLLGRSYNG